MGSLWEGALPILYLSAHFFFFLKIYLLID